MLLAYHYANSRLVFIVQFADLIRLFLCRYEHRLFDLLYLLLFLYILYILYLLLKVCYWSVEGLLKVCCSVCYLTDSQPNYLL